MGDNLQDILLYDMPRFSEVMINLENSDERTLIINLLDGGGEIRVVVESLENLAAVINQVLTRPPNQGSSTTDDDDDDDGDDEGDDKSDLFDPVYPINSALGGLNVNSAGDDNSFKEIETQQLHF